MSEYLELERVFAESVARDAGRVMLRYFNGDQQAEIKEGGFPVTIADKEINDMVIAALSRVFPGDGLIGEEKSTTSYGTGRKWFCDPIDGTTGYTWGLPTSMFSLGLVIDGRPHTGVVYDPFLDLMYTATKGGGSYCNGQRLAVSTDTLESGVVAVTSDVRRIANGKDFVPALASAGVSLATFSGAIYKAALVARGKLVGYLETGIGAHDMAAVELVVAEAGGRVTGLNGDTLDYTKPFRGAVVSNGIVHDQLVRITSGRQPS